MIEPTSPDPGALEDRDYDAMFKRCQALLTRKQAVQTAISALNAARPRTIEQNARRATLLAEHTALDADRRALKARMVVLSNARRERLKATHPEVDTWTDEQLVMEISRAQARQTQLIGALKARMREPRNERVTQTEELTAIKDRLTRAQAGSAPETGTVSPRPRQRRSTPC